MRRIYADYLGVRTHVCISAICVCAVVGTRRTDCLLGCVDLVQLVTRCASILEIKY